MAVKAVTFDFWNTLVSQGPGGDERVERWLATLGSNGHSVSQVQLERAMGDLWAWFNARWEGNEVVGPAELARRTLALIDVEVTTPLLDEMVAVLHEGHDPRIMQTSEGIGETLDRLRSSGVRIGIICDVGFTPGATLRTYLAHHGLLEYFDGWSFSDEVGCYKPDLKIFRHAAAEISVDDPSSTAHVGDLRRTDIAGARGAGWTSVRYAGLFDDTSDMPDADVVVTSHADLPAALGL